MVNYQNNVVDNYPLYQAFIDLYYSYIKQRTAPVGEIFNHLNELDPDLALDDEITRFYDVYAKELPQTIAYDKRNLIKLLNQIYEGKGTENSLKLLFRLIYNEDINISYPGDFALIPSSGKWIKEQYFTVFLQHGVPPPENSRLVFSNDLGDFSIITTGLEKVGNDTYRIRFSALDRVHIPMEQVISHTDGVNTYFVGVVIPSPQKLRILKPGKYWKRGKAIIIPGSIRDTVAVISSVSSGGVITGVEILEYGIGHDLNQTSIISPFPRKPTGTINDLSFEVAAVNPAATGPGFTDHPGVVYHHTLNIEDYSDGIADEVIGTIAGYTHNSYFLSYYLLEDYIGTEEIHTSSNPAGSIDNVGRDTDIKTWQESLALLMYEHDSLVETKGNYSGDNGQLSNQLIKLQDSYFYQAFSYLLESVQDPNTYKKMADLFHPAGTKRFSGYIKQINESLPYQFSRAFLVDTIVLREQQTFEDLEFWGLVKYFNDILSTPTDSIDYKISVKTLLDDQPAGPTVKTKDFTKIASDIVTYLDINSKTVDKSFELDSVTGSETIDYKIFDKAFEIEYLTPTHIDSRNLTKPKADSQTVDETEFSKEYDKAASDSQPVFDTRPSFTNIKTIADIYNTETVLEILTRSITKGAFQDTATIISIDGNGSLVDGRWDQTYSIGDYSETHKWLTFS